MRYVKLTSCLSAQLTHNEHVLAASFHHHHQQQQQQQQQSARTWRTWHTLRGQQTSLWDGWMVDCRWRKVGSCSLCVESKLTEVDDIETTHQPLTASSRKSSRGYRRPREKNSFCKNSVWKSIQRHWRPTVGMKGKPEASRTAIDTQSCDDKSTRSTSR